MNIQWSIIVTSIILAIAFATFAAIIVAIVSSPLIGYIIGYWITALILLHILKEYKGYDFFRASRDEYGNTYYNGAHAPFLNLTFLHAPWIGITCLLWPIAIVCGITYTILSGVIPVAVAIYHLPKFLLITLCRNTINLFKSCLPTKTQKQTNQPIGWTENQIRTQAEPAPTNRKLLVREKAVQKREDAVTNREAGVASKETTNRIQRIEAETKLKEANTKLQEAERMFANLNREPNDKHVKIELD